MIKYFLSVCAAAILSIGTAFASPITVNTIGSEPYGVFGNGYSIMTVNAGSYSVNAAVGQYTLTLDNVVQSGIYCVDIYHDMVLPGQYNASPTGITNPIKVAQITQLMTNNPVTDAISSAATQLAIWTVEYQTGTTAYNPTDSARGFWVSGADQAVLNLTNTFLGNMTPTAASASANLVWLTSVPTGNQNLVFSSIPEPIDITVLLIGVVLLLTYRRRMV